MDVLAVVDSMLANVNHSYVSSIQIASGKIPVQYHDAIAQKLVVSGESLYTLWDEYYGADFKDLSIDVVKKAYTCEDKYGKVTSVV